MKIENGATIAGEIKNYLKTCSNVIEISNDSNEEEEIKFINYFSATKKNNNFNEYEINVIIYIYKHHINITN